MSEQNGSRVALVSGANRGIGREVARQLAAQGYVVLLSARDREKARAAAEEIARATDGALRGLSLDVADPTSIEAAAEQVRADPRRLDVLVNNAGVGSDFGVSGLRRTSRRWNERCRRTSTAPTVLRSRCSGCCARASTRGS